MNAALRYLLVRSFVNGVVNRLKRLRQPKYLLGAVLGGAYFYFYFYKFLFGGGIAFPSAGTTSTFSPATWTVIGAAILCVATLIFSWILPASRAAITFTEAEIAFFFSAPISRRVLIVHKLLKSQLAFLFLAVMVTFLTGRFRIGPEAWFRVCGWWIVLNTLSMHRIAASFALQRLRERGMADGKRRAAVVLLLAALVAGVEVTRRALPEIPPLFPMPGKSLPDYNGIIQQIAQCGPLPYLLAPFQWVMGPYFSHDLATFLKALAPALGIMLLHFLWVVRADVSFEEASIAASQKRAALLDAHRQGRLRVRSEKARTPVWRLRPTGFAPIAFLWKGLIKFGGRRTLFLWSLFFITLGAGAFALQGQGGGHHPTWVTTTAMIIGIGCYITVLLSFIMVGQAATAQLRQGMASMDLLKTYPIPGWQLALGEIIAPVLLGTFLQWAALTIGAVLLLTLMPGGTVPIILIATGLAVLLPAFNISTAIFPCASALLFPGWFKPQDGTGQGLEGTGLRLLVGIVQLLAMLLMLLPVAFFGACGWFVAGKWTASFLIQAISAGGLASLILALEAGLGVAWLGSLYDSYDTSSS